MARTETANLRAPAVSRARLWVRRLGTLLLVCGLAAIAWTATVWLSQDPVTGLYTWYQQRRLSSSLERQLADPLSRIRLPAAKAPSVAAEKRAVAAAAARYRRSAHTSAGRSGESSSLWLGVHMVLVNGTDHGSLKKGPGLTRSFIRTGLKMGAAPAIPRLAQETTEAAGPGRWVNCGVDPMRARWL